MLFQPKPHQKITPDKIRECAENGMVASAIAEQAGVARQLIYKLAAKHGIKLPPAHAKAQWRARAVQRIVTGGIPETTRIAVGAASEMLAAADLLARGWQVYIPIRRDRHHDLIACKGRLTISIEVKSGYRADSGTVRYMKSGRNHSDHHAVVLLGEPVVYFPELPW